MPRPRYQRSVAGMFGAILAVLGLIAAIYLLSLLQRGDTPEPAKTVDYTAELQRARSLAPFPVLAPSPEPAGWRATSAEWSGSGLEQSWHLGFLTNDDEYAGLEQSNDTSDKFVEDHTRADQPGETVTIAGEEWQTLTSEDGRETALVKVDSEEVVLVTGTASRAQLEQLIESLDAG